MIERREGVSCESFYRDYVLTRRPVILTDAITSWTALRKWSPGFFKTTFGDRLLPVGDENLTVSKFVDRVLQSSESEPAPYLMGTGDGRYLGDLFPELLPDIEPRPEHLWPNWLEDRFFPSGLTETLSRGSKAEIFFGGQGARFSVLHWDYIAYHAFAFQIYGTKEWTLFAPSDSSNLYPKSDWPNQSKINDLENPDLTRFPRFANARAFRSVLEPGEMLFVPWGWWHTTHLTGSSISVSINTANASNWWALVYWMFRFHPSLKSFLKAGILATHPALRVLRSVHSPAHRS
ncbi:MAG: cupin-like domain-containing protein [Gammaproteobacteria bacterium]|nr:cupin-like domain-containing protein [Gammaproteobacteria bacterium]